MIVQELIEELKKFPPDMKVGVFSPWDGNGPCSYEKPELWLDGDVLKIDPKDEEYDSLGYGQEL